MNQKIATVLKTVQKPGRYAGGEYGQVIKDKNAVKARFAFCFPDTYANISFDTIINSS